MVRRCAVAAAAVVLVLWPAGQVRAAMRLPWAVPRPGAAYSVVHRRAGSASGPWRSGRDACEQRLERSGDGAPRLAVAGASFTAGVGAGSPGRSWAVLLARRLRWDAVVYGVPGAGYVRAGAGRNGPVAAEIAGLGLRALDPSLVIVQAGHDDIGVPPGLERHRVEQALALIRAEAPRARIALLTVFTGRSRPAVAYRTDRAIVAAATAADGNVIIMDPLAAGWRFPRARDGLHPTAGGDAWIAGQVGAILRRDGIPPAPDPLRGRDTVICDWAPPR